MQKIFQLEQHVADLIAAGEVVQRPASVVKELMENSIDAGAGIITVEIASGGMAYIRVTDNGCGIAAQDAKTAFLRHATSKLSDARGLEAIGTLGFRGEALAAIAAVSRIELLTREAGADEGVSLTLEAGDVVDFSPVGCPEGTTIIVRDLFFNTPARFKFMKSDRAESSGVASVVLKCALSRPDVSIRFIKDGKTEYHTPGDSRIDSCVYSLLGRDIEAGFIKAESFDGSVAVTGFVSSPAAARGNRSYQFFFVNGRVIRSLMLQSAFEQAYKNTLPSGRFPSCVLFITTKLSEVDVNVHPAKTEIKFVSEKQIFDGVYYAALGALERGDGENRANANTPLAGKHELVQGKSGLGKSEYANQVSFISMPAEEFRDTYASKPANKDKHSYTSKLVDKDSYTSRSGDVLNDTFVSQPVEKYQNIHASKHVENIRDIHNSEHINESTKLEIPHLNGQTPHFPSLSFRVVGETLNVYIIVEYQDSVWFIDKHAAHERIHFDALKRGDHKPMSESLLIPVICRLGHEDVTLLLENAEFLDDLGFSVESFGDDAVAVRHIPAEIDIGETESILSDICMQLNHSGVAEPAQLDKIYKAIACKAAIKAGRSSGIKELESLAELVISGEVSHCPHGRPVIYEITKSTLDKGFGRL